MPDPLKAAIRTGFQAAWGALITWLVASGLGVELADLARSWEPYLLAILFPVVTSLWVELVRWLTVHLEPLLAHVLPAATAGILAGLILRAMSGPVAIPAYGRPHE